MRIYEITANKTLTQEGCGLAVYNYKGNHFRVFKSFEDGMEWLNGGSDSLIIDEFDSEEELDRFLEIQNFLKQLDRADAIKIDGGPLLDSWVVVGNDNDKAYGFSWIDDDCNEYEENLKVEEIKCVEKLENHYKVVCGFDEYKFELFELKSL